MKKFYEKLGALMKSHNFPPELIANMDETFTSPADNTNEKVLTTEGQSGAERPITTSSPTTEHITTAFTIFANGTSMKPLIIFPLKNVPQSATSAFRLLSFAGSTKGWINRRIFNSWVTEMFVPEIQHRRSDLKIPNQRDLLLVDNHNSRASGTALRALAAANVDVLTFPAHTSHILQPLDQEVNLIYKKALKEKFTVKENSTAEERRKALLSAIEEAADEAQTIGRIRNSFKRAGIFPLDSKQGINNKFASKTATVHHEAASKVRVVMENRVITEETFIAEVEAAEEKRAQEKAKKQKKST